MRFARSANGARSLSIGQQQPSGNHRKTTNRSDGSKNLANGILGLGEAETVDRATEEGDTGCKSVASCNNWAGRGQAKRVQEGQAVK